ncbi:MAG: DUF1343 domain-containing protein [Bacteroidetes bacterium]|nr:DUF1343 domain-containing protein [Bacteroidota bacterium]
MKILLAFFATCILNYAFCQDTMPTILPGAYRTSVYVPLLKGKRVGVFANQTSVVGNTNLIDTLLALGVNVVKIFSPEHGFRGNADAGEVTTNSIDSITHLPIISLYGKKIKPTSDDVKDVDILLYDIQDVGVRFYTYISSMQYFIEAAAENNKPMMILDRPNPNGFYIDGPVLETKFKSFIGMQPIPVVYGMTIGEYAMMISGEGWLSTDAANKKFAWYKDHAQNSVDTPFHFLVIKCENYNHKSRYVLPVKPSPNLPDMGSVYWYPSICFFEGTNISEGRGTDDPFQVFGAPSLPNNLYSFKPVSKLGATNPKYVNQTCYGWNVTSMKADDGILHLLYLLESYKLFPDKDNFFINPKNSDNFFNKLAGNATLAQQIKAGKSESEIRESWQTALNKFKNIRKKYLLYADFE